MAEDAREKVPLLLLKTRSTPVDTYEEYFSTFEDSRYAPIFVPVLDHRRKEDALDQVRRDISGRSFVPGPGHSPAKYGAIIFTSQRAVEAFAQVVEGIREKGSDSLDDLLPQSVPLYAVGPATARQLRALGLQCPVLGEESGTGEVLSSYMLEHYNSIYQGPEKPPLLFLVGDKRSDIIPTIVQSNDLAAEKRCRLEELVVYETSEMLSFKANFSSIYQQNLKGGKSLQWVVVFSPSGCKAMLEGLDLLDEQSGRLRSGARPSNVLVATIGPTTRDHLINEFGFSPDVCAEAPSATGIANGIKAFAEAPGRQATN